MPACASRSTSSAKARHTFAAHDSPTLPSRRRFEEVTSRRYSGVSLSCFGGSGSTQLPAHYIEIPTPAESCSEPVGVLSMSSLTGRTSYVGRQQGLSFSVGSGLVVRPVARQLVGHSHSLSPIPFISHFVIRPFIIVLATGVNTTSSARNAPSRSSAARPSPETPQCLPQSPPP